MPLPFMDFSNIAPQPLQAGSSLGDKPTVQPILLPPLWKLIFHCPACREAEQLLATLAKTLEDSYLLISLLLPRLNKAHFFVFLFGANFLITFYSFNLFNQSTWDSFQIHYRSFQDLKLKLINTLIKACPGLSLKG